MIQLRRRHVLPGAFLLALCFPSDAEAQVLTAGSIDGVVQTEAGDPLRDARIVATSHTSGIAHEARSDADGAFRLRFVPPGEYDLLVELLGYAPTRVTGVSARSSAAPAVVIRLRSVSGPAQQVDEEPHAPAMRERREPRSQWIDESRIDLLPHAGRTLGDLARLSSAVGDDLSVEGLPSSLSTTRFAGIDWRPLFITGAAGAAPLASMQGAELSTNGVDVEWGDAAGGILSAYAATGSSNPSFRARATFAGDALPGATVEPRDSWVDLQGEARLTGPVASGRGGFMLGGNARQFGAPISPAWAGPEADALIGAVDPAIDLSGYTEPAVQEGSEIHAFASVDVPTGARHRAGAHAVMNVLSLDPVSGTTGGAAGTSAMDLLGTAFLASTLSDRWWNHFQLGVTHGSVERDSIDVAPLLLVPAGLRTAMLPSPRDVTRTEFILGDAFGAAFGAHDLKLGVQLRFASHDYAQIQDPVGTYMFGGIEQLLDGTGALARLEPVANEADWSTVAVNAFLQDRWRPTANVELLVGARLQAEQLPGSEVPLDIDWLHLTGIANNGADQRTIRFSPRAGVTWTPGAGNWRVDLATGVYDDRYDPDLVATWMADAGTTRVRRVAGALSWPPDGPAGGTTSVRLTVLDPDFVPPRSSRLSAGITRATVSGTSVQLAATFRRTENLPRRTDLNLSDDAAGADQYGRPLYGALVKQGGLLVAQPGSNRRFEDYDEVAVISADGVSKYWGVTLVIDHTAGDAFDVFARYTFSRTTDDWFGARGGAWSHTMPVGFDDWMDDTSDFDVPHRGVVGAIARAPFGLTLSALYRMQSGLPFTPGFRAGIDANGDGMANNDPVFVDPSVPGMGELIGRWSCLSEASGDFAGRNACRADPVHTLDASAALRLFTMNEVSASILVEAFDLLDAERRMPDSALYLIDEAAPLAVNGNVVTVPLVANPDFGKPRAWPLSGRMLRLGLSLNW